MSNPEEPAVGQAVPAAAPEPSPQVDPPAPPPDAEQDGGPGQAAPVSPPHGTPEPAASAFGSARPRRRRPEPLAGCVNVLPDQAGRLGMLSYLVPDDLQVRVGDAVQIPFGKRTVHGLVVGPGDPDKATRAVEKVFGVRSDPSDISLALTVAKYHFTDPQTVLSRLSPSSGRGADPAPAADLTLADPDRLPRVHRDVAASRRALLVRAPHVDPAALAAHQAYALAASGRGQVLVLCPTAELVGRVLALFSAGAARLDSRAPRGAWKGFCEGTVKVGVGTRSAALYAADHLCGIVVVDEEHPGHLEQTQPHTHARDLASARSRSLRVPLRLIALAPSPQAIGAVSDIFAVGLRSQWPRMVLLDRLELDPRERLLPGSLRSMLANAARSGKTPVVLAQTKAAVRRCVRCGHVRPCPECTSSLCRHPERDPCPVCKCGDGVKMRGWDKDRLSALFGGDVKVVNLPELAGTRDAGVVVLFDLDTLVAAPDLVPGRFAVSVVTQAAEAAGPGGTVVGLTDNPAEATVADLFGPRDTLKAARRFYAQARTAHLPPFGRLVTVRVKRANAPRTVGWPGQVHGPRKVGADWEILVLVRNEDMDKLTPHLLRLRRGGRCDIRVE